MPPTARPLTSGIEDTSAVSPALALQKVFEHQGMQRGPPSSLRPQPPRRGGRSLATPRLAPPSGGLPLLDIQAAFWSSFLVGTDQGELADALYSACSHETSRFRRSTPAAQSQTLVFQY